MLSKVLKWLSIWVAVMVVLFLATGQARAADVVDFIAIPGEGNVQASIDVILACQNGVAFGFNATSRTADFEGTRRAWDMSFAGGDGLLIQEYPLWLSKSSTPLRQDAHVFPYRVFHTLLWSETVSSESVATCVAGAGSGFCEFRLPINDCHIEPGVVADIVQLGQGDSTPVVSDGLVYEVRAYDPDVGTVNGAGIERVELKLLDYGQGVEIFSTTVEATPDAEGAVAFCAFSPTCAPWGFAANGYAWPNGEPISNGVYLLRAIVSTPDGGRALVQQEIELKLKSLPAAAAVPGGEFTMGSDTGTSSEAPVHTVAVDDFWIMQTEVTYGQYAECIDAHACTKPRDGERWDDPAFAKRPVANIDWQQANEYAAWVGGRLPTEAEWEKACRSTDARTYPWGNEAPTDDSANFNQVLGDSSPVGAYPAGVSPYGLLDMSGNVWEWTNSLDSAYPYDAEDGRESPRTYEDRVVRGGSYYYTQYQLVCSSRAHFAPETDNPQIGLRVVFDEPVATSAYQGVRLVAPTDATVTSPVAVMMEAEGLIVEPAGEIRPNAGHFHILVDTDFVPLEEIIPSDEGYLHFGQGQMTTTLELEPGVHTLRLQFANGAHIALPGEQYRDEITITVE